MGGQGALALAVVLLLFGGMLAISVDSTARPAPIPLAPSATTSISVAATKDYGYVPDTFEQVPTNTNLSVTFTDEDVLEHSFTISSREGFVIPNSYNPTQLDQLFAAYPPLYSAYVNESGMTVGWFITPPNPGWYEFVCLVSGHFQNGMYGFIAFGENLPPNLTSTPRVGVGAGNVGAIEASVAGAVVVAIVIAYVFWRRRHPSHKPPSGSF